MSVGNGFRMAIETDTKASIRRLRKIQRQYIPAAKKSAFRRATLAVVADVSTKIAAGLDVPRWMVRGVNVTETGSDGGNKKSSGSRLGRSGYIRKIDGAIVYLRHTHINPAGTERRQNTIVQRKRGGIRVNGVRKTYPKGFLVKTKWAAGRIYTRDGENLKAETIEMGDWPRQVLRNRASVVGRRVFRQRFEHEMSRRLKTKGA